MSLSDRLQQGQQGQLGQLRQTGEFSPQAQITGKPRVSLFPATRYGIVDGELVEVLGQDDIPGMSPVLWCSDISTGTYVPIPTRDVKHFATAGQALQALQNLRGYAPSGSNRIG